MFSQTPASYDAVIYIFILEFIFITIWELPYYNYLICDILIL